MQFRQERVKNSRDKDKKNLSMAMYRKTEIPPVLHLNLKRTNSFHLFHAQDYRITEVNSNQKTSCTHLGSRAKIYKDATS